MEILERSFVWPPAVVTSAAIVVPDPLAGVAALGAAALTTAPVHLARVEVQ